MRHFRRWKSRCTSHFRRIHVMYYLFIHYKLTVVRSDLQLHYFHNLISGSRRLINYQNLKLLQFLGTWNHTYSNRLLQFYIIFLKIYSIYLYWDNNFNFKFCSVTLSITFSYCFQYYIDKPSKWNFSCYDYHALKLRIG